VDLRKKVPDSKIREEVIGNQSPTWQWEGRTRSYTTGTWSPLGPDPNSSVRQIAHTLYTGGLVPPTNTGWYTVTPVGNEKTIGTFTLGTTDPEP